MRVGEVAVAGQRLLARGLAGENRAQLASAGQAEVDRGANALGGQWETVPGRVAGEEHAVLDRTAELVGDPVALVALRRQPELGREADRWVLDVVRGPEGADADAQLIAGREVPAVARANVA